MQVSSFFVVAIALLSFFFGDLLASARSPSPKGCRICDATAASTAERMRADDERERESRRRHDRANEAQYAYDGRTRRLEALAELLKATRAECDPIRLDTIQTINAEINSIIRADLPPPA